MRWRTSRRGTCHPSGPRGGRRDERCPMNGERMTPAPIDRWSRDRLRMIADQLEGRGIRDARVLEAMASVPRHVFVDPALEDKAYGDHALPTAEGQTISQPYIVARMLELLDLKPEHRVLEIG